MFVSTWGELQVSLHLHLSYLGFTTLPLIICLKRSLGQIWLSLFPGFFPDFLEERDQKTEGLSRYLQFGKCPPVLSCHVSLKTSLGMQTSSSGSKQITESAATTTFTAIMKMAQTILVANYYKTCKKKFLLCHKKFASEQTNCQSYNIAQDHYKNIEQAKWEFIFLQFCNIF